MSTETVYVEFVGSINDDTARSLRGLCDQALREQKAETLYLAIHSTGGFNVPAYMLHNFLRRLPVDVVTHNIGVVDSCALIVFLAGKRCFANPVTRFLFHGPTFTYRDRQLSVAQLRHDLAVLENDIDLQWRILAEKTKINRADFDRIIAFGRCWGPEEAEQDGLIEAVRQFSLPAGAVLFKL